MKSMTWRKSSAVGAIGALVVLTGCKTDHLVFTTYTKVGVEVAAVDVQPSHATLGYKRFEGAIIPVDVGRKGDDDAPKTSEDMKKKVASVYAEMDVENGWFKGIDISQVFATGKAATTYIETEFEKIELPEPETPSDPR